MRCSSLLALLVLAPACDAALDNTGVSEGSGRGARGADAGAGGDRAIEIAAVAADRLIVAEDGTHVVALRRRSLEDCAIPRFDATVFTVIADGRAAGHELEPAVVEAKIAFAPGGSRLVYLSGLTGGCRMPGTLRVAGLDGSGGRELSPDVVDFWPGAEGAIFRRADGELWAAAYDGRWSRSLGIMGFAEIEVDRRGAAATVLSAGHLHIVALGTGVDRSAGDALAVRWALGGERLVVHALGGDLISLRPDGSGRELLVSACGCQALALDPSGGVLAADVWDRVTLSLDVVLIDLRSGARSTLVTSIVPPTAGPWGRLRFSPDGSHLAAMTFATERATSLLAVAMVGEGPFWAVAADVDEESWSFAPWGDAVVVHPEGAEQTRVVPLIAEGADILVALTSVFAAWEPVRHEPRLLLVDTAGPPRLEVLTARGATGHLPGRLDSTMPGDREVFWAGGEVVYLADGRSCGSCRSYDLRAASPDGRASAILGTGVVQVAWAQGSPWLYFIRAAGDGGGIWRVDVPRG